MGYFSRESVCRLERQAQIQHARDPGETRRDALLQHLNILTAKLKRMEAACPVDPLHQLHDRFYYARNCRRYYENPQTIQELLYAIKDVKTMLRDLDLEQEVPLAERKRLSELNQLTSTPDGQLLMVSYWDYATIFREAQIYKKILSVLK